MLFRSDVHTFALAHNQQRILQEDNDGAHGTKTNSKRKCYLKTATRYKLSKVATAKSGLITHRKRVWRILKLRVRARNAHSKAALKAIILEWIKSH